jgi:hypothetical protein
MTQTESDTISVGDLFANLSSEADRLGRLAQCLDDALGRQGNGRDCGCPPLVELQGIDTLRQSLQALGQITAAAAVEVRSNSTSFLSIAPLAEGVALERVREACLGPTSTAQNCAMEGAVAPSPVHSFFEEF